MPAKVTCREYDKIRKVPISGLQRLDVSSSDIFYMIRQRKGFEKTARHFGIAKSTICYRLQRDFPIEYRELRKNPTPMQYYARCAAAYRAYRQERSIRKAAIKLGLPKTTVLGRIKFMEKVLEPKPKVQEFQDRKNSMES